jgi:hypothetical protein
VKQSPTIDLEFALGAALSLLLLAAFLAVPFLPMVDLPQHAAQISIWQRLSDPSSLESSAFELNLRTPYIGAYVAARLLAPLFGVLPALKVVIWASVVGHFAAFDLLVRTLGHRRWLSLLGLPLGLGYGFYFGFVSFIGALPFGLLAISLALRHRDAPTLRNGTLLALTLCATLATHGFAFGMTSAMIAPLLLRGKGTLFARFAPFVAPVLLVVVWLMPGSSGRSIGLTIWDPRLLELVHIPALWLAASGADHLAFLFGCLILLLLILSFGRPSRVPERYLPLAFMLVAYCLFPLALGGFGPLHPRFAAFIVPALLLAFEPGVEAEHSMLPGLVAATCLAWLGLFAHRLIAFARETRPIADFVADMPAGLSIRPIVFERTSEAFPALPALLHLSAYYVPEKAGRQGYSFAMYPTSVIRFQPGVIPTMDRGAEWNPDGFSAQEELGQYDCFLVHSASDRSFQLFGARANEVSLAFHEAGWWAYLGPSAQAAWRAHEHSGMVHDEPLVFSSQ